MKWLGIILDETLEFDHYWKSCIDKARKLLGALSGIGSSQWGISPGSWRQLYMGMVRTVALWGAELGWRGQKEWKGEFERLQYQALRKCTRVVLVSNKQKVNKIAAVEDVETILNTGQARYMARCMADPSTTEEIWEEEVSNKSGRPWNAHQTPWNPPKGSKHKDGFQTVGGRLLSTIDTSTTDSLSWGKGISKFEVEERDLGCSAMSTKMAWEFAISQTNLLPIYTDGSRLESGIVGGGYYFKQGKLGIRVGPRATVWDGEIAGLERGAKAAGNRDWDILLLTDSRAAIQATKNAGTCRKAGTRALVALGSEISNWQALYGYGNVKIGWVKSHIGIAGNEEADAMAKMGSEKESGGEIIEGGIRQRQN